MKHRTSLVAALLAFALGATACAQTRTDRSAGQALDDTTIATRAKAALIDNPTTKARSIDLEVYQGEVQLNGFVATAAEKQSAAETVQKVAGVKSVRNNLQVQGQDRSGGEVVDDTVITAKVKAALIGDSRTKAHQIEVKTNRGQVQLGGFVDSMDAKRAAQEVAQSISGVQSVSNDISVKN
jgi:hyperosmotically inducible protein